MTTPNLLWLDLETEGSDLDGGDRILEIGAVVTDPDLVTLGSFVRPIWNGDVRIRDRDVTEMHTGSGLLNDVAVHGIPLGQAEEEMIDWLRFGPEDRDPADRDSGYLVNGKIVLAGSGVSHFDRRFIRRYIPHLEHRLHYWHIDIGVVRRFMRDIVGIPDPSVEQDKPHRAIADTMLAIGEARAWTTLLGGRLSSDEQVQF